MIEFNYEGVDDLNLSNEVIVSWFEDVCKNEGKILSDISLIFCSDEYLLEVNRQHLDHDYYTDIITFDYCEGNEILGDLFISVDRVKENASEFNVLFDEELNRVMIHGVLHLCGYKDKTNEDELLMRKKEDEALSLLRST